MWSCKKYYRGFDNLSVQFGMLCADMTIYIDSQKNGKCRVRMFDGACEKPFEVKKFDCMRYADAFVDEFIERHKFAKLEKIVVSNLA